jgi:hypothetical protein
MRVACTNVCKAWAKSDKNWQFWKNDLDLNMFDLQHLEMSLHQGQVWPAHVLVSQIRNILMPVGSRDDDWFKSYVHICEKLVCIFVTLTLVQFLPNVWYTMRSTRWNKWKKKRTLFLNHIWYYDGMNVDVIDKKCPILYSGSNCCKIDLDLKNLTSSAWKGHWNKVKYDQANL